MKNLDYILKTVILVIMAMGFTVLISDAQSATCTSISRTNASALSVLTSTKYNTDLNTAYTALNTFDAGCIDPGSLESDALNTTQFAPLLKGLREGCKVEYSNASTLAISECLASVNGNFVTTTVNTSVAFGCTGCSAEVASTEYYVYIQTGSSGTTLTPLILTGAPNEDGYDNTGNKVLGRFYNNGLSDIDEFSIYQWKVNDFNDDYVKTPDSTNGRPVTYSAEISGSGVVSKEQGDFINGNCTNASPIVCSFNQDTFASDPSCVVGQTNSQTINCAVGSQAPPTVNSIRIGGLTPAGSSACTNSTTYSLICHGVAP